MSDRLGTSATTSSNVSTISQPTGVTKFFAYGPGRFGHVENPSVSTATASYSRCAASGVCLALSGSFFVRNLGLEAADERATKLGGCF